MSDEARNRAPPARETAEAAVLGALVSEPMYTVDLMRRHQVTEESFYLPASRVIVRTVLEMVADSGKKPMDAVSIMEKLQTAGHWEQIGGQSHWQKILEACTSVTHTNYYLDLVKQAAMLRQIVQTARAIEQEASIAERGDELLRQIPQRFYEMAATLPQQEEANTVLFARSIEKWEKATQQEGKPINGIETPWPIVTKAIGGIETGLTIIGGRPSAGKTTLEDSLAVDMAKMGIIVGRISRDQGRIELLQRELCREAGVSLPKLNFGHGRKDQIANLKQAAETLGKCPIFINDRDSDIAEIETWASLMHYKHDMKALTIDYAQLVGARALGRMEFEATPRISHISGRLKALALNLDIAVIVLAQLGREFEKETREPRMSDLGDSGALERDAHKIIFLFQDKETHKAMEKDYPGSTRKLRPVIFRVMKNKSGEQNIEIPMWFLAPYFRFTEAEEDFKDWRYALETQGRDEEFADVLTGVETSNALPDRKRARN